jgi:hypothetical protein
MLLNALKARDVARGVDARATTRVVEVAARRRSAILKIVDQQRQ